MKQVFQNLRTGEVEMVDVPTPRAGAGRLLVATCRSLISAGTERTLLEFGKAGWLQKARQQPEKVRAVLDKIRADGLFPTIQAVRSKLDEPLALGYCNVGRVVEVGSGVEGYGPGDRVVSNGPHAEFVLVPGNLVAKVPAEVSDEAAAFAVLGAIALQGIRLAQPTLGEVFVVTGLGLIGLLTVQLLQANGCRVLGIDLDSKKVDLARELGAEAVDLSAGEDPLAAARAFSRGRGVDGVLITASTKSSGPVRQAAQMSRKRGRIVLVGVTGLELSREDFYEKELSFQVSCSYGPGRYDPDYEEKGHDYPIGYVRWTEQRNFEAFLDMLAEGRVDVEPLISHRFRFEDAPRAYEELSKGSALGIVLQYGEPGVGLKTDRPARTVAVAPGPIPATEPVLGVIGAGNFSTQVLLPALRTTGARLKTVASSTGVSGTHLARRFRFEHSTTDVAAIFTDPEITAVVVATRHDSHALLARAALEAGKHVFVEKPLALSPAELAEVETLKAQRPELVLMVGFNRRFAPHTKRARELLAGVKEPKAFVMTVNAGAIPDDHWVHDPEVGGGRIVGEGCHYIDLLRFLAGAPIVSVQAMSIEPPGRAARADRVTFGLRFADGSIGTVHYLANGSKAFPKERLEIFCAGRILQIDNFRRMRGYGWPGFRRMNLIRQDKGHAAEAASFVQAVRAGGPSPIPFEEIVEVNQTSFEIVETLRRAGP